MCLFTDAVRGRKDRGNLIENEILCVWTFAEIRKLGGLAVKNFEKSNVKLPFDYELHERHRQVRYFRGLARCSGVPGSVGGHVRLPSPGVEAGVRAH